MTFDTKRKNLPFKELFLICAFYLILLLCALILPQISLKSWSGLTFCNSIDMSMLEWTGAFLKVFMFLLLLEYFRDTLYSIYAVLAFSFLIMGVLDFSYAINLPGTEKAEWLKILSFLSGSTYFLVGLLFFNKKSERFSFTILKLIFPSVIVLTLMLFIPIFSSAILPPSLSPDRLELTPFCSFILWMAGGVFIVSGLAWLNHYRRNRDRQVLVFSFVIFIFGLVSLMLRTSRSWDIQWWISHIVPVLTVLAAVLYLLVLAIHRSLTWRLLFSLGLVFGLTLLVTSGIMQSLLEKNNELNIRRAVYSKHLKMMMEESLKIQSVSQQLLAIAKSSDSGIFSYAENPDPIMQFKIFCFMKKEAESNPHVSECGFFDGKSVISSGEIPGSFKNGKIMMLTKMQKEFQNSVSNSGEIRWTAPAKMGIQKKYFSILAVRERYSPVSRIIYMIVDVTDISESSVIKNKSSLVKGEGRVIIDRKTGKFVKFKMHDGKLEKPFSGSGKKEYDDFSKLLISSVIDTSSEGKAVSLSFGGDSYILFSNLIKEPNWIVADVINAGTVAEISKKSNPKYILSAVGMIALLFAFAVLLMLLNYQLDKPLKIILAATKRLDAGDFSTGINSPLRNELGELSDSFDNMVHHLRESYENLEKNIKEKSAALDEAEKAGLARTTFFTNLSHELRTPLHGILSFSRLGANSKGKDPEKLANYFNSINESGNRLLKMIDEMLDIAKIKSGQMDFSYSKSSIYLIIMQVFSELRAAFEEKNISFVCVEPVFSTEACVDREKMSRVLRNIIGNSLKFSPMGSDVTVTFHRDDEHISFTVSDRGPGIPEKDIEGIFEEFFQSEHGKSIGGTGLGLAICQNIINNHNGMIYAGNNPAGGAFFTVKIPLEQRKINHG